jgi:Fe-S cluster biogenesis protein NfuA
LNRELREIERILDEKVRPALRAHGGDVHVEGLRDGVLSVRLLGRCSGCPSASLDAGERMEEELTAALPELVRRVSLVQTVSEPLLSLARQYLHSHD